MPLCCVYNYFDFAYYMHAKLCDTSCFLGAESPHAHLLICAGRSTRLVSQSACAARCYSRALLVLSLLTSCQDTEPVRELFDQMAVAHACGPEFMIHSKWRLRMHAALNS